MAIPGTPEWYEEQRMAAQRADRSSSAGKINFNPSQPIKKTLSTMFGGVGGPAATSASRKPISFGGMLNGGLTEALKRSIQTQGLKQGGPIGAVGIGAAVSQGMPKKTPFAIGAVPGAATMGLGGDEEIPMFDKSLDDYLSKYGDGSKLSEPILKAIAAREQALKEQASAGEEGIGRAYGDLNKSFTLSKEDEGARYAQAGEKAQAVGDTTQEAIAAARAASKSGRDQIRQNLGMEDVSNSLAEGYAAESGADDISKSAATNQNQQNYLQNIGNSRQDFMGSNALAATARGAEGKTALNRDLINALSTLDQERAGVMSNAQMQAQQLAQSAYQTDLSRFNTDRSFSADRDDSAWNRAYQETGMENEFNIQQQRTQSELQQAQLQQQEKMREQEVAKQKNTPQYAMIQERLRNNLSSPAAAVTASEAFANALLDVTQGGRPLTLESLMNAGLSRTDAIFALQEGQEYLKAYRK